MASFLSPSQKASLQSVMDDMHDTFKVTIKAFKEGKKIVLSTNPGYNHLYQRPTNGVQIITEEREFEARVWFPPKTQEKSSINVSAQDNLKLQNETVQGRIKVKEADYEYLKDAERITYNGEIYRIASAPRRHGLFGSGYITLYLDKVE